MTDRKLYALTDSEASELRRLMDQAQSQALTDQDGVTYEDLTYLMVPLNTPLEVHGTDLMATFENHMAVTGSGDGWVCSECGHRYSGPISKPQAWEHATIAALEALLQENES